MTGFDKEGFQPDEVPEQSEGNRLIVRIASLAAANEQSGGITSVMTAKFILKSHYRGCYAAILTVFGDKKKWSQ